MGFEPGPFPWRAAPDSLACEYREIPIPGNPVPRLTP